MLESKLWIDGRWVGGGSPLVVRNKYSGAEIGSVPEARREDLDEALAAAQRAAKIMAAVPAHRRGEMLARTAGLLQEGREELARLIAAEAGKALKFARSEVDRAISTFAVASEEAKRIHGETVPLDGVPSGEGYFGYWVRRPVGVVAAITPFNFPLNLVAHKVAPALAAGNSVVLKPASATPLSSVRLCQILEQAGVPAGAVNLLVGPGHSLGEWLVSDPRVCKVTFTGSPAVGARILAIAGIKKVTLELGNAAPVIIAPDGDIEAAAKRCALGAYYNSGQVCISVQRIYPMKAVYEPFTEQFRAASAALVVGDPLDERVDIGPMISEDEARRVESWVGEAQQGGAQLILGGRREGALHWPTILLGSTPDMKVMSEEVFGPVASVVACDSFEEALEQADHSSYGLQAAVFTRDIQRALRAVQRLNFGGIIINDTPNFRADNMPYGGNRLSGLGREGVRYAIEEMTNLQMVAIRLE